MNKAHHQRTSQTTLDFGWSADYSRNRFVIGECNALAADRIARWPDWPGAIRALVIHGEAACGKSHLASIWAESSVAETLRSLNEGLDTIDPDKCYILDHVQPGQRWPDEIMFHLLNRFTGAQGSLLVLTTLPPANMLWQLPDVASRFAAMATAPITTPDDHVLRELIRKLADDKGLPLDEEVIAYIVKRMERRFATAGTIIHTLDALSAGLRKKVTVAMARSALEDGQLELFDGKDHENEFGN